MTDASFASHYGIHLRQSLYSTPCHTREFPSFMSQFEWSFRRDHTFEMPLDRLLNISLPGVEESPRVEKKLKTETEKLPNDENQPPNEQPPIIQENQSKSRNLQVCKQEIIIVEKSVSRIVAQDQTPQLQNPVKNIQEVHELDDGHIYDEEPIQTSKISSSTQHTKQSEQQEQIQPTLIPEAPKQSHQQQQISPLQQIYQNSGRQANYQKQTPRKKEAIVQDSSSSEEKSFNENSKRVIFEKPKNPPPAQLNTRNYDEINESFRQFQQQNKMKKFIPHEESQTLAIMDARRSTMIVEPNLNRFIRSVEKRQVKASYNAKKQKKQPKRQKKTVSESDLSSQLSQLSQQSQYNQNIQDEIHSEEEHQIQQPQARQPLRDVTPQQVIEQKQEPSQKIIINIRNSKKEKQQQKQQSHNVQSNEIASEEEPVIIKSQVEKNQKQGEPIRKISPQQDQNARQIANKYKVDIARQPLRDVTPQEEVRKDSPPVQVIQKKGKLKKNQKQPAIQPNEIASEEDDNFPVKADVIQEPIQKIIPIQQNPIPSKTPTDNQSKGIDVRPQSRSMVPNMITPKPIANAIFDKDSTPQDVRDRIAQQNIILREEVKNETKFIENLVASYQQARNSQLQQSQLESKFLTNECENIFDVPKKKITPKQVEVKKKRVYKKKNTKERVNDRILEQPMIEEKTKEISPAPWKPIVKPWYGNEYRSSAKKYQKYKEQRYQQILKYIPGLYISKQEGELNHMMNKIVGTTNSLIFEIVVNPYMQIGPLQIKVPLSIAQKGQKLENGCVYMHQTLADPERLVQCNIQQLLFILNASPQPVRLVCCIKTEIKGTNL